LGHEGPFEDRRIYGFHGEIQRSLVFLLEQVLGNGGILLWVLYHRRIQYYSLQRYADISYNIECGLYIGLWWQNINCAYAGAKAFAGAKK